MLGFLLRRKILIKEVQLSGQGNFWQVSYQATVTLPGKRMNLEFLRAAPDKAKFYKVALAIKIAEDICREQFLPATPAIIKVDGDTIVVTIKEN